ncbi:MAG: methyltransferase [Proteobacteria bacterium]|nr:methyltransferase [Pseudomonadota bacterium]
MTETLVPDRILSMGFGFFSSQTLLTATQLGVFTELGKGPKTGPELGTILGLHARGIFDFLDALVALQLLNKNGTGPTAVYSNTAEASEFLDQSSEAYVGGIFTMSGSRLYRFWGDLAEALKTGQPQSEVKHKGKPLFDEIFADEAKLRQFCAAMSGLSRHNFDVFTDKFPFANFKHHLDLGASTGILSKLAVTKHQHLKATAFDLPAVATVTREHVQAWGLEDRIQVVGGSFLTDKLPRADLITLGLILHDWNLDQKRQILRAAYDALEPGGALVVIENLIDDDRRENAFGLLMSLNMLIEFGDAFDYSFADFSGWCKDIGFTRFEKIHIHGPCSAGIAYK